METCKHCTREIVEEVPENSGYGHCAGLHCGHQRVYGLYYEDCRQVIVRTDIKSEQLSDS
jgi:hypothetical protein